MEATSRDTIANSQPRNISPSRVVDIIGRIPAGKRIPKRRIEPNLFGLRIYID